MVLSNAGLTDAATPLPETWRVSVSSGGAEANAGSQFMAVSGDGRFVAFESQASDLVPGDTNNGWDVFLHDREGGETELVSAAPGGGPGSGASREPSVSDDGRFIAFASGAADLVPDDTNGAWDVFVRDRLTGRTTRVAVGSGGEQAVSESRHASLSADGRFVAFESLAPNLVPRDTNDRSDVFVHDRTTGVTKRASVGPGGAQADRESNLPAMARGGCCVAFDSLATNLVSGDTNGRKDVFVHVLADGATTRVSVATGGRQASSESLHASISSDGTAVAFESLADDLAADGNNENDVFVHDRTTGTTILVSVAVAGGPGTGASTGPSISGNGRRVAFTSLAEDLVEGDTNRYADVFVRDLDQGATVRASSAPGGGAADRGSGFPSMSGDGRSVAFDSGATNLVAGDENAVADVFLHRLPLPEPEGTSGTGPDDEEPPEGSGDEEGGTDRNLSAGDGPHASFRYEPALPTTGATIGFTDASTSAGPAIVAWAWDFGDGATSTEREPTHRYAAAGTYLVKLTVRDDSGGSGTASLQIKVFEAPPDETDGEATGTPGPATWLVIGALVLALSGRGRR